MARIDPPRQASIVALSRNNSYWSKDEKIKTSVKSKNKNTKSVIFHTHTQTQTQILELDILS